MVESSPWMWGYVGGRLRTREDGGGMLPEVCFCEPAGEFVAEEHANAEQEG